MAHTINLYSLSRTDNRFVKWNAPAGHSYFIDVSGNDTVTLDVNGQPVMAYEKGKNGGDGKLVVSLDGAPSISATLLHSEDDKPRKYYFATDGWNNNPLNRPAFILQAEGLKGSPVESWARLVVMVVS